MKNLYYFTGSFMIGLIAMSVSIAAIPNQVGPTVTEIQAQKVNPPVQVEQEDEFSKLNALENKYAESWEQQQKLRAATKRVASGGYKPKAVSSAPRTVPQKKNTPVIALKFMLLNLNHAQISIPVGAEDEARRFYCDVLGLKEIEKPEALKNGGGFWLQLGEMQIHFGPEGGVNRRATRAHLAYEVSDLKQWKVKLEAKGIITKDGVAIPGFKRMEFRDPFGNRVEFLAKK